ncbi:DUF4911 domain-containing protein [Athalassotoga saccharophila]|uniref:DUF4911 domain-containing protein n=1 Tax=Athalassotoga saccharophila TaxID=1441386 RepID=UPI0018D80D23|nr:DUF4911 domain-containing protein [Athalassotoga saccharophila]BBJ27321.1 hypothetical protein ATHSA_0189 [Athalassotoga saccharophila]
MSALEYDLYVKIEEEDIHMINYMLEAEDNLLNVRNVDPKTGLLKIIVIDTDLDDMLRLLEYLKDDLHLEVVKYEPSRGVL